MMNSLHLILAALILSACPHKSLRPQDRDAIQHVLLLVEQQAADGPAVPIIREDGGEQPDLIVAEAARRVDHAGWRVTAVPRMIVSETREGMSASLRQLLCEVARRQAADHLLLLT